VEEIAFESVAVVEGLVRTTARMGGSKRGGSLVIRDGW